MSEPSASRKVGFAAFFDIWAEERRWAVPDIHWETVDWLEHRGSLAVLRCFRGFGKSTLLAVYNAWRYYNDPAYRILHQGDQDRTAFKTSRDTKSVLMRHPLTRDMPELKQRGEQSFWWVAGNPDERNPSLQAAGITSNITSSRCDEAQNDDVEVPRNIQNPEAREKMRYRLGEQTHCMVPGARQLFVGTPHTHDSLYDEMEGMGADCLTIRMFAREHRIDDAQALTHYLSFVPEMVFAGIGKKTRLLKLDRDFSMQGTKLTFNRPPGGLVDFYAGHAWPERFTPDDMLVRRRKCKTLNEWDSQYQLRSRPLHEVRLDPDKVPVYNCEPRFDTANRKLRMWLGDARIVGASLRWDPASGKLKSDVSALALVLQDDMGRRYWHRAEALMGEVATYAQDGRELIGGQVFQICAMVKLYGVRRVTIETNGAGTFAPTVLRQALAQQNLPCAVVAEHESRNKNRTILSAFEPLLSSRVLLAHVSVIDGPAGTQMREWSPATTDQPDDYLDSAAKAILDTPERIGGGALGNRSADPRDDWRPDAGAFEAELTF